MGESREDKEDTDGEEKIKKRDKGRDNRSENVK